MCNDVQDGAFQQSARVQVRNELSLEWEAIRGHLQPCIQRCIHFQFTLLCTTYTYSLACTGYTYSPAFNDVYTCTAVHGAPLTLTLLCMAHTYTYSLACTTLCNTLTVLYSTLLQAVWFRSLLCYKLLQCKLLTCQRVFQCKFNIIVHQTNVQLLQTYVPSAICDCLHLRHSTF